jgi:hypothetical protein
MVFAMEPAVVGVSAATQSGLAAEMSGAAGAVAPALLGVTHMGADADSLIFAEVCRAVAAAHLGVAGQHAMARGLFSGAQSLAAVTAVATEAMRAAAATI